MLLPPGEGGRGSSSLSVPKVPDALLIAEPTRERSECMAGFLRPARWRKWKSMGVEGLWAEEQREM